MNIDVINAITVLPKIKLYRKVCQVKLRSNITSHILLTTCECYTAPVILTGN